MRARGARQHEGMRVGWSLSFGRVCRGDSAILGEHVDLTALAWDKSSARRHCHHVWRDVQGSG